MTTTTQLAKHFREVFFGGNWCGVSLKAILADVTYAEAVTKVHSFNTLLALTYHMGYYVTAVLQVMKGGPLDARDMYSFDHPEVTSEAEWQQLQGKIWAEVEELTALIAQLPEDTLWQDFVEPKYGTYFYNFAGITGHTFYHLGQVALIKKLLREGI